MPFEVLDEPVRVEKLSHASINSAYIFCSLNKKRKYSMFFSEKVAFFWTFTAFKRK